ncbi:MAG TPA: hypothetical protein VNZ67_02090, partial [bacterium]|nr:hypothetical protein [bacterium]
MTRSQRSISTPAATVAVALAAAAWFLGRWALGLYWRRPLLSPGAGVLLLLALAGAWATVEEPRLSRDGGRKVGAWLAGAALLAAGEALLYYRVEAKDRVAGLGFAALAGGALLLWPRLRPAGRAAAAAGMALLAGAGLWMGLGDPHVPWDLYQGAFTG